MVGGLSQYDRQPNVKHVHTVHPFSPAGTSKEQLL